MAQPPPEESELSALRAELETLRAERARDAQRHALLTDASVLISESLDYNTTLAGIANLCVPRLCDWCTIYALDGEVYRMVEAVHVDPEKSIYLRQARQRVGPDYYETSQVWRELRSGRSFLHSTLSDADLRRLAKDDGWFRLLRDVLRCRSWMIVPLLCRGRMLGTLGLSTGPSGRSYGPDDLALVEEISSRLALALDNARLFQEAQEAVRARDEFLSIASHELRTPLTTLHLQVELLRRLPQSVLTPERLGQAVTNLERQTKRLVDLLRSLFDISRINTGRLDLTLEDIDLGEVCRDVAARFELDAQRAGSPIALSLCHLIGRWDRLRLDQVVTNLVANALKYGDGKPIEMSLESCGDKARLQIRDEGPGIHPAQQERIFDRFDRGSRGKHDGSLGLGLYIAKRLVLAMGGTISVRSAPHLGATFVVELPLRPNSPQPP